MKEHKYIVVDEKNGKPMVFHQDQFVFVNRFHRRNAIPLRTYTEKQFKKLVRKSNEFRDAKNFDIGKYRKIRIL